MRLLFRLQRRKPQPPEFSKLMPVVQNLPVQLLRAIRMAENAGRYALFLILHMALDWLRLVPLILASVLVVCNLLQLYFNRVPVVVSFSF